MSLQESYDFDLQFDKNFKWSASSASEKVDFLSCITKVSLIKELLYLEIYKISYVIIFYKKLLCHVRCKTKCNFFMVYIEKNFFGLCSCINFSIHIDSY